MKLLWISFVLIPLSLKAQEITGNDKDQHGCIGSAGYVWSEAQQKCIRLFEEGKPLQPIKENKSYSSVAYLVFSKDKKRVEVYLPDEYNAFICDQKKKGSYENQEKKVVVDQKAGKYSISIDQEKLYQE
jgi:hypothetical protein